MLVFGWILQKTQATTRLTKQCSTSNLASSDKRPAVLLLLKNGSMDSVGDNPVLLKELGPYAEVLKIYLGEYFFLIL
jgi:hypothetical protein